MDRWLCSRSCWSCTRWQSQSCRSHMDSIYHWPNLRMKWIHSNRHFYLGEIGLSRDQTHPPAVLPSESLFKLSKNFHATSTEAGEHPLAFPGKMAQDMSIWTEALSFPRVPSYTLAVRSVATSMVEKALELETVSQVKLGLYWGNFQTKDRYNLPKKPHSHLDLWLDLCAGCSAWKLRFWSHTNRGMVCRQLEGLSALSMVSWFPACFCNRTQVACPRRSSSCWPSSHN